MNLSLKKRPGTTVVGIAFERDRIEAVELRRPNGSSEIRRNLTLPLDTDPLAQEPEGLGKLLRAQLDQAGFREHRCAVALPTHPASCLTLPLPDLPEADRRDFLDTEAERGFAQNPDNLLVRHSIAEFPAGSKHATLVAFERETIQRIEAILRAARLHPLSITLGLEALHTRTAPDSEVVLDLVPSGNLLQLRLAAGQGLVALRVIDDAFIASEGSPDLHPDLDLILRELRITLGQLPPDIRSALSLARVIGPSDLARSFAAALRDRAGTLGLRVDCIHELRTDGLPFRTPTRPPATPALATALLAAAGATPTLDFLPPRVSAWQQFAARHASRHVAMATAAGGGVLALAILLFLGQQFLLWRWQSRWESMRTTVTQLEGMQREVRRFEPWFDPSVRSLSILRRLTEAFPEDGSVSAKAIEIRAPSKVICSGTARDPQSWLRMLDNIRNAPGVTELQVEQVRGKSPIEFSFHFQWQPGARP